MSQRPRFKDLREVRQYVRQEQGLPARSNVAEGKLQKFNDAVEKLCYEDGVCYEASCCNNAPRGRSSSLAAASCMFAKVPLCHTRVPRGSSVCSGAGPQGLTLMHLLSILLLTSPAPPTLFLTLSNAHYIERFSNKQLGHWGLHSRVPWVVVSCALIQ